MISQTSDRGRYALSFTSGSLLAREACIAAALYLDLRDWQDARAQLTQQNLLQTRTTSSAVRLARETVQRLAVFSIDELTALVDASPSDRGLLLWVAACRRYAFIGDFAEEVVRERYLLLTPRLGHDEFDSFVNGKALWHPELTELRESTRKKLRSNVFRMLTEAGLLESGLIQHAIPSENVQNLLQARNPSDLRFLPIRIPVEATR
ncbi:MULTISPECIES: DUF1819 family protein [unclassified Actinobaculum]|uniref:DUF1819 family protein n=1 Tax=unclassified Actinobaculum TaxID=2609299 RepID=UPI000D528C78|nr:MULTISPECIES: DUF1819 family protein [unclassified Actinobaculum]AWE42797.1 DUF1819 domain-containing protein [Actinobaculum sp. 313]RTE49607.1 DUF1819 family protein [Actinobaculum sp. 352]